MRTQRLDKGSHFFSEKVKMWSRDHIFFSSKHSFFFDKFFEKCFEIFSKYFRNIFEIFSKYFRKYLVTYFTK